MEMFKESKIKPIIQVKVLVGDTQNDIENKINNFLIDKKIGSSELVDIKYQETSVSYGAMVIYKECIEYGATDIESR